MASGVQMSGGRNRSGRRTFQARSDINITPLVDVMLVMMIIFMVTAPMLTVGIPVDLPRISGAAASQSQTEPVIITMSADGKIFLQEAEVSAEGLKSQLALITKNNPNAPVYVRGDRTTPYGQIVELMASISTSGYSKVSLIAESGGAQAKPKKSNKH